MIIIRLAGGLGNQIFQLGAGLLLAKRSGIRKIVLDDNDLSAYKVKRKNELINFFDFNKAPLEIIIKKNIITKFRIPKLLPLKLSKYPFVSDINFQYALLHPNRYLLLLDGYFQSCLSQDLFNEELDLLKKFFNRSSLINNNFNNKISGCVIHIRGRDFVELGWDRVASKKYYEKAVKKMREEYHIRKFFVVTDDISYAKKLMNSIGINYELIGSKNLKEDFYLIGNFQYRILSASTFSLWASALGNNKKSVVIAPSFWSNGKERNIYLPNEVRINDK